MDDFEENMSSDDRKNLHSSLTGKVKPKKKSLVERELETSLTARVTSPVTSTDGSRTSRYGRARRLKSDPDYWDTDKALSTRLDSSPVKSPPAYKMHAMNSPVRTESPKTISIENKLENAIENIYNANISLSRFGSDEKKNAVVSPAKKFPKIYMRKDIIQTKEKDMEKEETVTLIKNMFSPSKEYKPTTKNSHLNNILERSAEKYSLNGIASKPPNGLIDPSSVVKTLDFDGNKKKRKENRGSRPVLPKSDLFELEAKCDYQVGDLAWARVGTYPFWPCIITREPASELFVRKKLFGRIERNIMHVTFFGDNGRRSWLVETMLRKFLGRLEFEAARDQFTPQAKRKDTRLYAAFFISEKKQALWNTSVEEAETLLLEPKHLRIDLFYDLLCKTMTVKPSLKGQKLEKAPITDDTPKIVRMDSDVSLSESLFDTLFSEDDGKADDNVRPKNKRHKSLDVSEVVTACLDNMAAKTGITKIQRQSHMDRWLQKAKSKTPEKSQIKVTVKVEKVDEKKENIREREIKVKDSKKKKKAVTKVVPLQKPYSFRKPSNESRNLLSHHNEHDYSCKFIESKDDCFLKLDKIIPMDDTAKVNQAVNMPHNDITLVTNCDKICEDNIKQKVIVVSKDMNLKENNKAEQESVSNINEEDTSRLHIIEMEPDQSRKNSVDVIPPEIETEINDESSSKMEEDQSLNNQNVPTEESKSCDHLVPSDNNLNITLNASNLILGPTKVINTDHHFEKTNEKQSPKVTEDILSDEIFKEDITIKEAMDAVDNSETAVITEKKGLISENNAKDSIGKNPDCKIIDCEMSTDDDITNCDSDVDTTDFVVDTIDKLLTENKTIVTVSERVTNQNDAKYKEIINLEDEVCNNTKENIQCKDSKISVQESEDDNKFCEPTNSCIRDEVLSNSIEKSTFEDKLTQSVTNENNSQDNKAIERIDTAKDIDNRVSLHGVNEIDEHALVLSNQTDGQDKKTISINNLSQNVTNNSIESIKENGFTKNLAVEVIKEVLNLENVSINSPVSDIPTTEHDVTSLSNRPSESVACNSFHVKDSMQNIKNNLLQDSDTVSDSELDDLILPSKATTSVNEVNKVNDKLSDTIEVDKIESDVSIAITQAESDDVNLPKTVKTSSDKKVETKINIGCDFLGNEMSIKIRRLCLRKSKSPSVTKENGFHDSKDSSTRVTIIEDLDSDVISVSSEDSSVSFAKKNRRSSIVKTDDRTQDPKFLKYLEATQDALMDEHPELTYDEIVAYLYKSWSYKESCTKKSVETEESHELQNVKEESTPPKKVKRKTNIVKRKVLNIEKVLSNKEPNKLNYFVNNIPRDKPKRKTVQPYYNEDFSDIEDEIEMFKIFQTEPKTASDTDVPTTSNDFKSAEDSKLPIIDKIKTEAQTDNNVDISPEEYYDEVEAYFKELTQPKPNVFKGFVREKVCEICENATNLVKCKKCNGMFHVECVKKETEVVDITAPVKVRGRKKKKKSRGFKPKTSTDSNGLDSESQSDEKSQDLNASDEQNMSIEDTKDPDCYIVADAETFEAQLAIKMKEMLETADVPEYDSYSSDDGLDWSDTVAGKCEIIDIKLKTKLVENTDYSDFSCNSCQMFDTPLCFVCKLAVSPKDLIELRQRCHVPHCHKYYHLKCLDQWPQTQFNSGEPSRSNKKISEYFEALTCPRHVCHTCVCDDPRGCKTRFSGDKLARCVRCPATYHSFTKCLPAGTQILTASHIICPRHYEHRPGKVPCHVNTGWCFICALGGSLICCEYCPTSFHAECLNIRPPDGGYMCEDCETGRLPLYGEMVWVKLGHYRWWPGIVLHPCEIPSNIMSVKHTLGEFVVRFFGQYDHYWVNRGRVFPFQEGDSGRVSGQKSKIDEAFTLAIQHAQRAFEIIKNSKPNEEESDIASSLLPPHYVKLKVNKPCGSLCGRRVDVEESSLTQCECDPHEDDPCGPYSHCLNRMLLTECGTSCRAGERCNNRAFEKRLYPKLVPYRTPQRGWGLKTLEDVMAGQFVIEYVGELIDEEEFRRRMSRKHEIRDENFYFLTLDKERMIDAGPKGNLARFMNHCCEPNCETQKWTVLGDVRVGLFALRDIPANSEVTFNYNLECAGIDKKRCLCGAKRCSGYIGAKPKQDETQSKKPKLAAKRTYKKRKPPTESPSSQTKPKRLVGRPRIEKPRELTEIEKDLLIIKNAINGLSSDSECSGRLTSVDVESERKDAKALKRKRVDCSTEDAGGPDCSFNSPSGKKVKRDSKMDIEVGD